MPSEHPQSQMAHSRDRGGSDDFAVIARLDALFQAANRSDAPGLVVGIALQGRPVYRRGYGLACVQQDKANSPNTRMRIASISKHFTSLACWLLAEEGKLDIDAPASRYLPELTGPRSIPSLRQFMSHTSGHRCTLELGSLANGAAMQPPDWQLRALARQREMNFAAGEGQIYCNGTYHALSIVIERVAGVPFEDFLKTRIFEPLGMHDTLSVRNAAQMVPRMAAAHIPVSTGGWQNPPIDSDLLGDGGIISSIDDMLKWIAHLNGPKLVGTEKTWQELLRPVTLANGSTSTYALGLKRHCYRGVEVIHHSGGLFGINCQMLTVPAHGLDLIIMINGAPLSATGLARKVVDAVLADRLLPEPTSASAAQFEHLVGHRYQSETGFTLGFDRVDSHLGLSLFNLLAVPVLQHAGDVIRAGFEDIGLGPLIFEKTALAPARNGDPPDCLSMSVAGDPVMLQRLSADPSSLTTIAAAAVGTYRCDDVAADAQITNEGGLELLLKGDYSSLRTLQMQAFSAKCYGLSEMAPAVGEYVLSLDVHGSVVTGFWIDTLRARRVRFDRVSSGQS
jgi:D-aminopeptidase